MNERETQLERLLSEQAGTTLDANLAASVASDPELARLAAQYARLDRLLRGWRPFPAEQAGAEFVANTRRRIEADLSETLSAYAAGELPAAEARAVARRFAADATASRALRDFEQTDALLSQWAGPLPPVDWDGLQRRISSAVRHEAASRRRGVRWVRVASGLAIAAAIALVAIIGMRRGGTTPAPLSPDVVVELARPDAPGAVAVQYDMQTPANGEPVGPPMLEPAKRVVLSPTPRSRGGSDEPSTLIP